MLCLDYSRWSAGHLYFLRTTFLSPASSDLRICLYACQQHHSIEIFDIGIWLFISYHNETDTERKFHNLVRESILTIGFTLALNKYAATIAGVSFWVQLPGEWYWTWESEKYWWRGLYGYKEQVLACSFLLIDFFPLIFWANNPKLCCIWITSEDASTCESKPLSVVGDDNACSAVPELQENGECGAGPAITSDPSSSAKSSTWKVEDSDAPES